MQDEQSAALIEGLCRGDRMAFDQLFNHFFPVLCVFAGKLLNDPHVSKEVVQDVLYKVWQKRSDFTNFQSLKAFVYISVRNVCFNHLDKEKRRSLHREKIAALAPVTEDSVLTALFQAEVMREIQDAIEKLPPKYRTVIAMAYREGLTTNEIAQKLNVPVDTVHKQKARGLTVLRSLLSGRSLSVILYFFPFL